MHEMGSPYPTQVICQSCSRVATCELFGHVKGAFTGANYTREGLAGAANGGTLFLDEVGDIPLQLQVKLLRLIETGTFRPVGSSEVQHVDFRLVCATHKNLEAMVADGEFRQDLYYRINVFPIHVPSLGERLADLPLLARAMLRGDAHNQDYHLTQSATALLQRHEYRGNIRELRNILWRARVLANTNVIDKNVIKDSLAVSASAVDDSDMTLKSIEQKHLKVLMQRFEGNKTKVAVAAGISLRSLYRKLQGGEVNG